MKPMTTTMRRLFLCPSFSATGLGQQGASEGAGRLHGRDEVGREIRSIRLVQVIESELTMRGGGVPCQQPSAAMACAPLLPGGDSTS